MNFTVKHSLGVDGALERLEGRESGLDVKRVLIGCEGTERALGGLVNVRLAMYLEVTPTEVVVGVEVLEKPLLIPVAAIERRIKDEIVKTLQGG